MAANRDESSDDAEELESEDASNVDTSDDEGFAGVSSVQTTCNLAKCMIGEGMLSLAAGLGASTGLRTGIIICIGFAVLMSYTFSLIGRVCHATKSNTFIGCVEVLAQASRRWAK